MEAKAREKARRILADHHPEPLEPAQVREIDRIVAAAESDPRYRV
jgi:trimethylamine:corrinoid methyltransferase-like protein